MKLVAIPPEHVGAVWPLVADWLAPALESDKRFSIEHVRAKCEAGQTLLWVAWDGQLWAGIVTGLYTFPLRRELEIWLVGGVERKRWVKTALETLTRYAVLNGCAAVFALGRRGWRDDMADFDQRHILYVKELT